MNYLTTNINVFNRLNKFNSNIYLHTIKIRW